MSCYNCNSEPAVNKTQVENIVDDKLKNAGVLKDAKDCSGAPLGTGEKLVTCGTLEDEIINAIASGKTRAITGITEVSAGEYDIQQGHTKQRISIANIIKRVFRFDKSIDKGMNPDDPESYGVNVKEIAGDGLGTTETGKLTVNLANLIDGDTIKLDPNTKKLVAVVTGEDYSDKISELESAIATTNGAVNGLNTAIGGLQERIAELEKPCSLGITSENSDYVVKNTDELILTTGSKTLNFGEDTAPIGTQWTVVNDDEGTTTLASTKTIIPPYKGTLKVTGKNAVATVLKSKDNEYRVFGQTEGE